MRPPKLKRSFKEITRFLRGLNWVFSSNVSPVLSRVLSGGIFLEKKHLTNATTVYSCFPVSVIVEIVLRRSRGVVVFLPSSCQGSSYQPDCLVFLILFIFFILSNVTARFLEILETLEIGWIRRFCIFYSGFISFKWREWVWYLPSWWENWINLR